MGIKFSLNSSGSFKKPWEFYVKMNERKENDVCLTRSPVYAPSSLVWRQIRSNSDSVISQLRGQPHWLLLCRFITAELMDLFDMWPPVNLAGDLTTYSEWGKSCSIETACRMTCQ